MSTASAPPHASSPAASDTTITSIALHATPRNNKLYEYSKVYLVLDVVYPDPVEVRGTFQSLAAANDAAHLEKGNWMWDAEKTSPSGCYSVSYVNIGSQQKRCLTVVEETLCCPKSLEPQRKREFEIEKAVRLLSEIRPFYSKAYRLSLAAKMADCLPSTKLAVRMNPKPESSTPGSPKPRQHTRQLYLVLSTLFHQGKTNGTTVLSAYYDKPCAESAAAHTFEAKYAQLRRDVDAGECKIRRQLPQRRAERLTPAFESLDPYFVGVLAVRQGETRAVLERISVHHWKASLIVQDKDGEFVKAEGSEDVSGEQGDDERSSGEETERARSEISPTPKSGDTSYASAHSQQNGGSSDASLATSDGDVSIVSETDYGGDSTMLLLDISDVSGNPDDTVLLLDDSTAVERSINRSVSSFQLAGDSTLDDTFQEGDSATFPGTTGNFLDEFEM